MGLKEIFTRDNKETKKEDKQKEKDIRQKEKETAVMQVVKETNKGLERLAVETVALSYISKMENVVNQDSFLWKKILLEEFNKIKEKVKTATDEDLPSVIQKELQKAQIAAKERPRIAALLLPYLDEALKDPKLQLANTKTLEKQVPISWETILESSNTNIANFKRYIEEPNYENTYNQVFDMMSLSNFQPKTISYENKDIVITQEHIYNFQKLIKSQLLDNQWKEIGELDLSSIRLEKVNKEVWWNAEKWRLSFYPKDIRVIVFAYKQWDNKKTWYVTFGNIFQVQKDLAKGLEENIDKKNIEEFFEQIPETIDDTNKGKFWDYIDNKLKLVLDAHWGTAALDILFQKKDMISYLKQWNNLQKTFDSVIKYGSEDKGAYCFKLFEWIKNDQILMSAYAKLVIADSKYLWPVSDLLKRQNIVLWLIASPFFNIEKDTELFTLLLKEKASLQQALSVAPTTQNKNVVESLQSQVEWFAKMIVNSPLWAGIITLLDSFFGKWGLMKKLGVNSKLAEQLDKQFKEKYAITWEQKDVITNVYDDVKKTKNNDSIIIDNSDDNTKTKEKIIKMWKFENKNWIESKGIIINRLLEKPNLLDAKVLSNLFVLENWRRFLKTDSWDIDYNDIFEVEDKKEIIKSNIDKKKLESVLSSVITNSKVQNIVLDTHIKLNSWVVDYWKPTQNWIQTEADYASFVAAYLMWWSKSDWGSSFHYVITETNMPNERVLQPNTEKPEQSKDQKTFLEKINKITDEIKKVKDGKYDGTYDISSYSYDAGDSTRQKPYQDNILKSMEELFDNKKVEWVEKTNFELLLTNIINAKNLLWDKSIPLHLKNMFIYMNKWKTSEQVISQDVIDNIVNMSKEEVVSDKLVFSDDLWNNIELSYVWEKLEATYIPDKSVQVAATQKSKTA